MEDVKPTLKDRLSSAFAERSEKTHAEEAADCTRAAVREQRVKKYEEAIGLLAGAIADELCAAIRAGKSVLDLGIWERSFISTHRRPRVTFEPLPERPRSCLAAVFAEAAAEDAVDECAAALRAFLEAACEGVTLERKNLYLRQEQAPSRPHWWPRREYFYLVLRAAPA